MKQSEVRARFDTPPAALAVLSMALVAVAER